MDLHHLLKELTFEAEMALWKVIIHEVKLNVSPGSSFHCSAPGWFRVCFANMDDQTMDVALTRIESFAVQNNETSTTVPMKRQCWQKPQNNLRLSFKSRRMDDIMMPQCLMSPHSPLPQSPLVRARN